MKINRIRHLNSSLECIELTAQELDTDYVKEYISDKADLEDWEQTKKDIERQVGGY